ncbi:hypothetical protein ZOSMA_23G00580 [Zostera marina]|uniref:Uncharacterized protein n=1 Tax=Zostera marina TaxID=29655 RepID=A0A0K9PHD8_ZOSMR|nr:hypothetical protein ZOSMA_23G00580 [Zostera marina]
MQLFFSEITGKDITELITSGREKLASVPSGGGVAVTAAPTSGGTVPAKEDKKNQMMQKSLQ